MPKYPQLAGIQMLGKILRNRNHDTIRNKFDKENKD